MDRRSLLRRVGLLGAAALAGCTGATPGGDPTTLPATTGETTESPNATGETGDPHGPPQFDPDGDPFERVSVGSREGVPDPSNNKPRTLRVWNDAETGRSIGLRVTADGEGRLDREIAFPAGGYLVVSLLTPATYAVRLSVGSRAERIDLPRSRFDCNHSVTTARVGPDGGVTTQTLSSAMGCPAAVVDHEIETVEASCGNAENRATISVDGARMTVSGTVAASTPCHVATIEEVGYDDGAFRVSVSTAADGSNACVQCLGAIRYESTLTFEGSVPEHVVEHHSMEERVTVARTGAGTQTSTGTTTGVETATGTSRETSTR